MRRASLLVGLGAVALVLALAISRPPLLDRAQDAVFDGYQRASPRAFDPDAPVHIIDIDEAALDLYGQWPWPRDVVRKLAKELRENGYTKQLLVPMIRKTRWSGVIRASVLAEIQRGEDKYFAQAIRWRPAELFDPPEFSQLLKEKREARKEEARQQMREEKG